MPTNKLYFGDCLEVMRQDIPDESVDLIYLDPPFNSKRLYNAFIGDAQWVAFNDTWRWHEAVEDFENLAKNVCFSSTMEGLRKILGEGPNLAYLSYMGNRLDACFSKLKSTGTIYLHCDKTMSHYLKIVMDMIFLEKNFRNEIIWCYSGGGQPRKDFPNKHDTIFRYSKSDEYTFNADFVRVPYESNYKATVFTREESRAPGKTYRPNPKGKIVEDWWTGISRPYGKMRAGYPTEKPYGLLERIIGVSCPDKGVVLDPFCGCGTTIHAAQNQGRRWIGIDICVNACKVIEARLREHFDTVWSEVEFIGFPKTRDDAKTLASLDAFRFERWAASLVDGMEANKRQRGDKGIDGRGRLPIRRGKFIDIVSQVKGGGTGPGDVQAFNGARQEAGADLGIFTCFEDRVTQRMRDAAASTGRFMDTPVVQIFTVEDFFAGRHPQMPRAA